AKMRIFNTDGSEGRMAGNAIRCVGKYLWDNGYVTHRHITIETASGVRKLTLHLFDHKVTSVTVQMGKAEFNPALIPVDMPGDKVINEKVTIGGKKYDISCVSIGNPHCVVICDNVYNIDVETIGPRFENAPIFPERINTEFVKIIDKRTIRMRVWERGNGETPACGTGACAAAVAAVENGYCDKDTDISVRVEGGELIVRYTDEGVFLTGDAEKVFEGIYEY
ncbi:MAG: diaminopimelate epimerase, partial [Clostridia bacterium]|nr:diaminopimelate epimerase [Clostridia bacterium]